MNDRFFPLMCAVSALVIILAVPLTRLYYQDPSDPVYMMTVWGFRILPLCMPLAVIRTHFSCYNQTVDRNLMVNILEVLDGMVSVSVFTAILIPFIGMNSVYIANVLNGVVSVLYLVGYSVLKNRRLPRNMEEMMVIPPEFGVPPEDRMDLSVRSMEEVVAVSENVQSFCLERGIDWRRSYLSGLFLEEMAGNVVNYGFRKDKKKHSIDIRVAHKEDKMILRIKDDCQPFDSAERREIIDQEDMIRNVGIRVINATADEVEYQNILGLNVLTIRI